MKKLMLSAIVYSPALKAYELKSLIVSLLLLLGSAGCSDSSVLKWEESVVLPDDRIVVLKREQHFDNGGYVGAHSFEFKNPATKQKVTWQSDGFFSLVALLMVNEAPYILVRPTFSNHTEWAGCPYPSIFIYKFNGVDWQQIPYATSPFREMGNNATLDPKADREYIKGNDFKLLPGRVNVRSHPTQPQYYGLNLSKFPTQVFQCPNQKRIDLK